MAPGQEQTLGKGLGEKKWLGIGISSFKREESVKAAKGPGPGREVPRALSDP